jgi:hypothetical protein
LRNSTASATNFVDWAAVEAARSPRFRAGIDRLRRLAAGEERGRYPRSTGPLTLWSWRQLERAYEHRRRLAQGERPRAWRNSALPTDDGLRHLRDYLRGCRKLARTFLGSEQAAPLVHDLVARAGYRTNPWPASAPPPPTGPHASTLAAHVTGASWGAGATANRVAWHRARPHALPATFALAQEHTLSAEPPPPCRCNVLRDLL